MKVLPLPRKAVPRALALALSSIILSLPLAQACTRLTYLGSNQSVITARSMDWKTDVATHLWIFPQGMQRNGEVGANSIKWTSRYGSVIASGYDIATTDGVNQAGLVTNLLWLVESQYPVPDNGKPGLSSTLPRQCAPSARGHKARELGVSRGGYGTRVSGGCRVISSVASVQLPVRAWLKALNF